ncbi:MAG: alpha/beta hydrolase [Pseudomonadales bacterium]
MRSSGPTNAYITQLAHGYLLMMSTLFAAACSPLTLVNLSSPNWQQKRHSDIEFHPGGSLRLDVYTPAKPTESSPVIVFFYGGSWQRGSKEAYRFAASQLTRAGFVVVIPDYRLFPEAVFPQFVHDGAEAVSWAMANAERYGGDPRSVFLMGHSAGAQIAALLHYDERYLSRSDATHAPAGLVGLSGPYDFLPLKSETLRAVFPEPLRADSQPVNFPQGNAAPALLLHGAKDETVRAKNSKRLAQRVNAQGGMAETIVYEGRGHAGLLLALARPFASLAPVVEDLSEFVNAQVNGR